MLTRRVASILPRFAAPAAPAVGVRHCSVKSNDPTYEDDRWLEAMLEDPEKTVEEKYAAQKEREVLKAMMKKMRQHTEDHVAEKQAGHKAEVDGLKEEVAKLQSKIADLEK